MKEVIEEVLENVAEFLYLKYYCIVCSGRMGSKIHFNFKPKPQQYIVCHMLARLFTWRTYLVVDCGGGTVDLTIRTLLPDKTLEEETVSWFRSYGSVLKKIIMEVYKKLIYKFFCPEVKLPFDGESNEYEPIELDLEKYCPALIQYITGETKERLENEEWIIDIKFDDVMRMFDPAVNDYN
ncbi:unnamed protein product [Rhizophagus irregularis]|nr:unnamed protein product [Rhizophagus irregularis]